MNEDALIEMLLVILKGGVIFFAFSHMIVAIIIWRQVIAMHSQVETPTGKLLILINFANILFAFVVLLITIFVLGTQVP